MKNFNYNLKQIKFSNKKGVTLISLVVTIIILVILSGVIITTLLKQNGIMNNATKAKKELEEAQRIEKLMLLSLEYQTPLTKPIATMDFVQPHLFNEYTKADINDYVKTLKRAGYDEIILQNVMVISGGKNSDISVTAAWYETNLIQNTSKLEVYRPDVLDSLIEAIEDNDMKIYIGLALSNDWWNNNFTDEQWRTKNISFFNDIINEIYKKYGNYNCFEGIYWSYEIYPNNNNYSTYWAEMINANIEYFSSIDDSKNHIFMISPFISSMYNLTYSEINEQWKELLSQINFRDKDVICMQDCLGTSTLDPSEVLLYLTAVRSAVKNDSRNLEFWLNVENYVQDGNNYSPSSLERYKLQLQICSMYAEKLASFSYSHYYNPNLVEKTYDKDYRSYYTNITGDVKHKISTPEGGVVFEDENGDEAPLPKGFTVSPNENIINEGLVISDEYGNEFVWIPVNGGIAEKGHIYTDDEYSVVYYTRYLNNGIDINITSNDLLPNEIISDETQIKKYSGFYVGRYESSFNYNNGQPTVQIKYSLKNSATTSFAWQYADSETYTGYLWNNINYTDAKNKAEDMCKQYNYNNTVKTGLINGTQWDTILKWIHSNDESYSMIYNGTTWGNYTDSVTPATEGNYESGVIKASGSNENWKVLNLYDIAGNLSEWTSELANSKPILRSNGYNDNGNYGAPSYGLASDSFQYSNAGFRIVLYIK